MNKIINGYEIPVFTPTGRYVLVPALNHLFKTDDEDGAKIELLEDGLIETDKQLSEKDFRTTVLATGDGVSEKICVGDSIQIVPNGQWVTPLDIDGTEYFLIKDSVIVGIYK
jgi:hypothetical protein